MAKLLTEEWDTAVLAACGQTYRLSEAPCPMTCIEYPAQTDNTQAKSSRQMDLVKVTYPPTCLRRICIMPATLTEHKSAAVARHAPLHDIPPCSHELSHSVAYALW